MAQLWTFPEEFDNAAWTTKNNISITADTVAAPNGSLTADKFVENTSNAGHSLVRTFTFTAEQHTASCYFKQAGRIYSRIFESTTGAFQNYNLSTGALGSASSSPAPDAATITAIGNDWYRCTMTWTPTAGSKNVIHAMLSDSQNGSYTGDGTSGIYAWGAVLNTGGTADPYPSTPRFRGLHNIGLGANSRRAASLGGALQ